MQAAITVTSQLYLNGRVIGNAELLQTRKGKLWVRLLLETELVRADGRGGLQSERITLPISFFSREAEAVKDLRAGTVLTIGAHLYGSEFTTSDGATKRGVQIIADAVFTTSGIRK